MLQAICSEIDANVHLFNTYRLHERCSLESLVLSSLSDIKDVAEFLLNITSIYWES